MSKEQRNTSVDREVINWELQNQIVGKIFNLQKVDTNIPDCIEHYGLSNPISIYGVKHPVSKDDVIDNIKKLTKQGLISNKYGILTLTEKGIRYHHSPKGEYSSILH